jgi:hypothetical protein
MGQQSSIDTYEWQLSMLSSTTTASSSSSSSSSTPPPLLATQPENVPACTFAQLYEAFHPVSAPPSTPPETHNNNDNSAPCWSLAEEILRIPTTAVVNRLDMPRLGRGRKGTVHAAWITVPSAHDTTDSGVPANLCAVAVKTDACYSWWKALSLWATPAPETSQSCLADDTWRGLGQTSFGGAEYTGALVQYAATRHHDTHIPGLLPTWGIVVRPDSVWQRIRSVWYRSGPRGPADPRIVGTLMPLTSFAPLTTANRSHLTVSVEHYGRAMLPAARGLHFVNHVLGLVYQDIKPKNVGLRTLPSPQQEAFVYDHTYLGRLPQHTCRSPACHFCPEAVFSRAGDRPTDGHALEEVDFFAFRHVLIKYLKQCPGKRRVKELEGQLLVTPGLSDLITVLEAFIQG